MGAGMPRSLLLLGRYAQFFPSSDPLGALAVDSSSVDSQFCVGTAIALVPMLGEPSTSTAATAHRVGFCAAVSVTLLEFASATTGTALADCNLLLNMVDRPLTGLPCSLSHLLQYA